MLVMSAVRAGVGYGERADKGTSEDEALNYRWVALEMPTDHDAPDFEKQYAEYWTSRKQLERETREYLEMSE